MFAVVLVDNKWGIAKDGKQIPSFAADMERFKQLTMGHTVLMGRKTYETLPDRKPLKGRRNVILSKSLMESPPEGFDVYPDPTQVLLHVVDDDVAVIGGQQIYEIFMPMCERIYVAKIYKDCEADLHFRDLDADPNWVCRPGSDKHFVIWDIVLARFCEYRRVSHGSTALRRLID